MTREMIDAVSPGELMVIFAYDPGMARPSVTDEKAELARAAYRALYERVHGKKRGRK